MVFDKAVKINSFQWEELPPAEERQLDKAAQVCKGLAVAMVARANSGHPAGALSSMKMYMAAYGAANVSPQNCDSLDRDFVVVSHGHTSAAAYATLAYYGFVDAFDAVNEFRRTGSRFQGHVERMVPGIDWGSGCLGQGLSAGAGFALAQKARGYDGRVYVLMGDGEQPKGQIAEARRLIAARKLTSVTALIDVNDIQISGRCGDVMPAHIKELWEADGWQTLLCDGDSFAELYAALKAARAAGRPTAILCRTTMGKGVSFMEDKPDYHGKAASGDLYRQAMKELGQPDLVALAAEHKKAKFSAARAVEPLEAVLDLGAAKVYGPADTTDNRSAFGSALAEVGQLNYKKTGRAPVLVFDCDLAGSVKTGEFAKKCPDNFIQCGIQENATATAAGAASAGGVVSVWADFGVFGLAEAYNQQRMNDVNHANEKLVLTHVGLDVGEDGMTHQCIDYVALMSNFFNWKLVVPADPNQTDRATRWALKTAGNVCLAMGRSKLPALCANGKPLLARDFTYGEAVKVREGKDAAILALGAMAGRAVQAAELLAEKGVETAVYAVSCPLEIDESALTEAFQTGTVLTVEDHNVVSGMGSLWLARAEELGLHSVARRLGVHRYGDSGPSEEVYAAMGLSADKIAESLEELKKVAR
ncbi:transketolase [Pyramidobacter sp.]|uniref:transketolase n=1 Tax=Pyramidobacter sp. TaxID=1943581 RepID=UPI0025EB7E2A|nr:transketolase [Pyramidobacter sp.]MCI7403036.1 transketolase [Pyramidobacter sp.]MDY3213555.1 transketolase [Pyramidobacter sp.]